MSTLAIAAGLVLLVLFALALVAYLLPRERTSTVTVDFDASPEEVYDVYADPASQPSWRDGVASVDLTADTFPRAWVEHLRRGPAIHFEEVEAIPSRLYRLRTSAPGRFRGTYDARFEAVGGGRTRGTFTEQITTEGPWATLLMRVFVDLDEEIRTYAEEATAEIARRRSGGRGR